MDIFISFDIGSNGGSISKNSGEMIETYIPYGNLPNTPYAGVTNLKWFGNDNRENYLKAGNSKFLNHEVTYDFNAYGYRSDEFDAPQDLNVLTIGCSIAFGLGLNRDDTYSEIFCRWLSSYLGKRVANWNLAWCGKSNDYISRILLVAVPVLRPDIVLVNFTSLARREFFDIEGRCLDYFPMASRTHSKDKIIEHLWKSLDSLASPLNDQANFYYNFKLTELLLDSFGIQWLYSILVPDQVKSLHRHLNPAKRIPESISRIDVARDGVHPGRCSNSHFAEVLFSTYQEKYC